MEFYEQETDSLKEYHSRLDRRVQAMTRAEHRLSQAMALAKGAEKHLGRVELPRLRALRAAALKDSASLTYEREVMWTLMYEALDHICMALRVLEFSSLELRSSADGLGLVGESALDVLRVLGVLEKCSGRLLSLENELHLPLDFSKALDEKRGITFGEHPHWQDFVRGSIEDSFREYWSKTHRAVLERLHEKPAFWEHQTVRLYLERRTYFNLLTVLHRLERTVFRGAPRAVAA